MLKEDWKITSKSYGNDDEIDWHFQGLKDKDYMVVVEANSESDAWDKLGKLLGTMPQLEENEIQDIADIIFREISLAMSNLKKYTQIVTEYLLTPSYVNENTSYEQALNCVKMFNTRTEYYNILFEKMKSLGAK